MGGAGSSPCTSTRDGKDASETVGSSTDGATSAAALVSTGTGAADFLNQRLSRFPLEAAAGGADEASSQRSFTRSSASGSEGVLVAGVDSSGTGNAAESAGN